MMMMVVVAVVMVVVMMACVMDGRARTSGLLLLHRGAIAQLRLRHAHAARHASTSATAPPPAHAAMMTIDGPESADESPSDPPSVAPSVDPSVASSVDPSVASSVASSSGLGAEISDVTCGSGGVRAGVHRGFIRGSSGVHQGFIRGSSGVQASGVRAGVHHCMGP